MYIYLHGNFEFSDLRMQLSRSLSSGSKALSDLKGWHPPLLRQNLGFHPEGDTWHTGAYQCLLAT